MCEIYAITYENNNIIQCMLFIIRIRSRQTLRDILSKVTTLLLSIEGTTTVPVTIVEEAPETTGLYLNT